MPKLGEVDFCVSLGSGYPVAPAVRAATEPFPRDDGIHHSLGYDFTGCRM